MTVENSEPDFSEFVFINPFDGKNKMTDDFNKLLSNFDEVQLDSLRVVLQTLISIKHERITGVTSIELHSSNGTIGDIYSWSKKKIRSSRKNKVRNTGTIKNAPETIPGAHDIT